MEKETMNLDEVNKSRRTSAKERRKAVVEMIKEQPLSKMEEKDVIRFYLEAMNLSIQTYDNDIKIMQKVGILERKTITFLKFIERDKPKTRAEVLMEKGLSTDLPESEDIPTELQ